MNGGKVDKFVKELTDIIADNPYPADNVLALGFLGGGSSTCSHNLLHLGPMYRCSNKLTSRSTSPMTKNISENSRLRVCFFKIVKK